MREDSTRTARIATAAVLIVAGCGARAPVPGPPGTGCDLVPDPASSGGAPRSDTIRVALAHAVDAGRAPAARDAMERLVFRQLYETLVEVDCDGRIRPGLATSWTHEAGGRRWRFGLRPEARFWDGSPVSAEAVARSLSAAAPRSAAGGAAPLFASVTAIGRLELVVDLMEPTTAAERFAAADMTVVGGAGADSWPLGSGPYRPSAGGGDPLVLRRVGAEGSGAPTLTFPVVRGRDARAALDAGADVVVSADPAVIAYARALADLTVVPLSWSRTYVLVAPERGDAIPAAAAVPAEALDGLARDAVRAEARPARASFWWTEGGCGDPGPAEAHRDGTVARAEASTAPGAPVSRVVHPSGDAVARGIAERLVALAGPGAATPAWLVAAMPGLARVSAAPVSVGLAAASLADAVRRGEALAFVVPLPRAPGGPCVSELLARDDEVARAVLDPAAGWMVTPLVDVRTSVILRQGLTGVRVDGDGTLRFGPRDPDGEDPWR